MSLPTPAQRLRRDPGQRQTLVALPAAPSLGPQSAARPGSWEAVASCRFGLLVSGPGPHMHGSGTWCNLPLRTSHTNIRLAQTLLDPSARPRVEIKMAGRTFHELQKKN